MPQPAVMANSPAVSIFTYHYVRPIADGPYPGIKGIEPELFRAHLEYLRRRYDVLTMEDFLEVLDGSSECPANAALLTFDDGYKDHMDYVLPLLREFNFQGTFFIPWKVMVVPDLLQVNKIQFVLAVADELEVIDFLFTKLDSYRSEYQLLSREEYARLYARAGRFDSAAVQFIKRLLQRALPPQIRNEIADGLFDAYVQVDRQQFARDLYMTPDDVCSLAGQGMYVGNHGFAHERYRALSPQEQEHDIWLSLDAMKSHGLFQSGWTMCYPYGEYTPELVAILQSAGCRAAFTTGGDVARLNAASSYEISRLDANDLNRLLQASV